MFYKVFIVDQKNKNKRKINFIIRITENCELFFNQ